MSMRSWRLLAAAVLLLPTFGCRDAVYRQESNPCGFTGITVVDAEGHVIQSDPDDWCVPAPGDTQSVALYPVGPNPATGPVQIRYHLPTAATVRIVFIASDCSVIWAWIPTPQPAGTHTVVWERRDYHLNPVPAGIYRCQMSVDGEVVCHGDVQVP
jgi:hypothetical protein